MSVAASVEAPLRQHLRVIKGGRARIRLADTPPYVYILQCEECTRYNAMLLFAPNLRFGAGEVSSLRIAPPIRLAEAGAERRPGCRLTC